MAKGHYTKIPQVHALNTAKVMFGNVDFGNILYAMKLILNGI